MGQIFPELKEKGAFSGSGEYALGWGKMKFTWSKYPFIFHAGSNGMNLALIFLCGRVLQFCEVSGLTVLSMLIFLLSGLIKFFI